MGLNETPKSVMSPEGHYVFVEKIGPFSETARQAWEFLRAKAKDDLPGARKTGAMAHFRMKPEMIYRAGFLYDSKPSSLPEGLTYLKVSPGKYSKFVVTGSYAQLPQLWGKTMELVERLQLKTRDDFYIESYANDPATTAEPQLITELMIPTA